MIIDVYHVIYHAINYNLHICWLCHFVKQLKGLSLQSIIRILKKWKYSDQNQIKQSLDNDVYHKR